jgi:hypothetical protein
MEFQQALIQLNTSVASIQVQNSSLLKDKNKLEQEIEHLKDWAVEKERHDLKEIARGVFACVDKNSAGNLQSAVKNCATCFEKRIKSPLQQQRIEVGQKLSLTCFTCKATIEFRNYIDVT